MSYNSFDPKDLWDITKFQNFFNPLSPWYIDDNNDKNDNDNNKKPQKKYIRTKEDDENDKVALIVCYWIYRGFTII